MKRWMLRLVCCTGFMATPALLLPAAVSGQGIPTPVRIAGALTVDGIPVSGTAGERYRIEATAADGESYDPAAVDQDGLNDAGVYVLDIPVFDASTQPGGARIGETAVLHVTEDGAPLIITSPPDGAFMVERPEGTSLTIDIAAEREAQVNARPVASAAGPEGPVAPGDRVALDGAESYDPDPEDVLSYLWEELTDADVVFSGAEQARAEFTVPEVGPENNPLVFRLTVTDNDGLSDTAQVSVTVVSETNQPPVADAGVARTVRAGETVQLDGSGSTDADGRITAYQWEQIDDGPVVDLRNANTDAPFFTAPNVSGGSADLRFRLTVSDDDGAEDVDTVTITISPAANVTPIAVADADATVVEEGVTVTLDAAGSSDPDGFIDLWQWRQIGDGPDVALSNPRAKAPTFVAPSVDVGGALIVFELTVTDNEGLSDADTLNITLKDNGITIFPENVVSFRASTDREMGIEVNNGRIVRLDPAPSVSAGDAPDGRIYGAVALEFILDAADANADFIVHLSDATPEERRWYRYRAGDGWKAIEEGVFDLGDAARYRMVLADGGDVDGDRTVNGRFSGILSLGAEDGRSPVDVDDTGHDKNGETNNCFITGAEADGTPTFGGPSSRYGVYPALLAAALAALIGSICRRRPE